MSKVNADSEAVRQVAEALKSFEEAIEEAKRGLHEAVASARENWQDENGERIEGEIDAMAGGIEVSDEVDRLAQEAKDIADKIDDIG